jgi:hypothetical protein
VVTAIVQWSAALATAGGVLVAASTWLPWDEGPDGRMDGWDLWREVGMVWSQRSEGWIDAPGSLVTAPPVLAAALVTVAAAAGLTWRPNLARIEGWATASALLALLLASWVFHGLYVVPTPAADGGVGSRAVLQLGAVLAVAGVTAARWTRQHSRRAVALTVAAAGATWLAGVGLSLSS